MKLPSLALPAGALAIGCSPWAQIPPPNAAGVAAGHAHIYTTDQ
ncbi:MAG TPA: hypothetical protein VFY29_12765 [Terriglobia bacterium]|nr:hypothetical protein [Terriglobia bacterium]